MYFLRDKEFFEGQQFTQSKGHYNIDKEIYNIDWEIAIADRDGTL